MDLVTIRVKLALIQRWRRLRRGDIASGLLLGIGELAPEDAGPSPTSAFFRVYDQVDREYEAKFWSSSIGRMRESVKTSRKKNGNSVSGSGGNGPLVSGMRPAVFKLNPYIYMDNIGTPNRDAIADGSGYQFTYAPYATGVSAPINGCISSWRQRTFRPDITSSSIFCQQLA